MCSPLAIGSRQASWTIWARCRGGNLLGPPRAGVVQQEFGKATLLIASADPPDGGGIAFQPFCHCPDRLSGGDGQDDAGVLDLEETVAAMACDRLQDRQVSLGHCQGARFAPAHGSASSARAMPSAYPLTDFLARLLSSPTRSRGAKAITLDAPTLRVHGVGG